MVGEMEKLKKMNFPLKNVFYLVLIIFDEKMKKIL